MHLEQSIAPPVRYRELFFIFKWQSKNAKNISKNVYKNIEKLKIRVVDFPNSWGSGGAVRPPVDVGQIPAGG